MKLWQKIQRDSRSWINPKKSKPRCIIVKFLKTKDTEGNLENSEKEMMPREGKAMWVTVISDQKIWRPDRDGRGTLVFNWKKTENPEFYKQWKHPWGMQGRSRQSPMKEYTENWTTADRPWKNPQQNLWNRGENDSRRKL